MGLFDLFRFERRSFEQRAAPSSSVAVMRLGAGGSSVSYSPSLLLKTYGSNAQIARVVRFVSRTIASVRWRAFKVSPKDRVNVLGRLQDPTADRQKIFRRLLEAGTLADEVKTHPALETIRRLSAGQLDEVNVRQVGQAQIELVGECFLRIVRDSLAPPSILIVQPTAIEKIPMSPTDKWKVRQSSGSSLELPFEDIVYLKDADPADPYGRGIGLFGAVAAEIDADKEAAETIRNRFKNRGLPEVLIELLTSDSGARSSVGEAEREAIETRFLQKFASGEKSGGVHFVNRQVKVTPLGTKLVDMDVVGAREAFAELTRKVRGVPPELLGQVENSNRATIEAATEIWARYGMAPELNRWEQAYEVLFTRLGASDIVYLYDDPIPANEAARIALLQSAPWALTRDEAREVGGFDPTQDDVGVLVGVPMGISLEPLDSLDSVSADLAAPTAEDSPESLVATGDEEETKTSQDAASLNGAQVQSAISIVTAVAQGQLPRPSGVAMLVAFFSLSNETAEAIMGEVGKGFEPKAEEAPAPTKE